MSHRQNLASPQPHFILRPVLSPYNKTIFVLFLGVFSFKCKTIRRKLLLQFYMMILIKIHTTVTDSPNLHDLYDG